MVTPAPVEWPPPTDEVARLVNIVGPAATLALIESSLGRRIYVPAHPGPDDDITQIIGAEAAQALAAVDARNYIKVPVARRWRVLVYRAQGRSYEEIAYLLKCSQNTVWRVLADNGQTGQLDLFGGA